MEFGEIAVANRIEKAAPASDAPRVASRRKTWREKLADDKGLPVVQRITGKLSQRLGTGTFVIPAPCEVDALMKRVPKGRLVTIDVLRQALARKHGTTIACPLTTGISHPTGARSRPAAN